MGLRRRLPARRGELPQVVLVGEAGQAGQEIAEVGERVLAVALAGDDERVEDGGALAGVGVADQQPVRFTDARGARRVLVCRAASACGVSGSPSFVCAGASATTAVDPIPNAPALDSTAR